MSFTEENGQAFAKKVSAVVKGFRRAKEGAQASKEKVESLEGV